MKKMICAAMVSIGLLVTPSMASAQSYNPLGNTVFNGNVNATVGMTTLSCGIQVTLNAATTTSASIPTGGFALSGGLCGLASITNLPVTVTYSNPGVHTLTAYIKAATFLGTACEGYFKVTYDNGTQTLTIPEQTIGSGSATCKFKGSAKPNHTFTI